MTVPDPRERPTLKVPEAARLLGVSDETVYAAAEAGDLPSLRLGRRVLIVTAGLLRLLQLDTTPDMTKAGMPVPAAALTDPAEHGDRRAHEDKPHSATPVHLRVASG